MFYILGADEILQLEYNPAWHNFKTSHPDPSSVFRMCQITKNEKNANKINFETSPDVLKFHTANIDVAIAGKNSL
jgi:hypothetical protein